MDIKKIILIFLIPVLFLPISGIHKEKTTAPRESSGGIKVATWNIFCGTTDLDAIERTIREVDVDVICLQETVTNHQKDFRQRFNDLYPHQTAYLSTIHNGPTILSKFPLTNTKYVESTHEINGFSYATVQFHGQPVEIVNLHLSPLFIPPGSKLWHMPRIIRELESVHAREIAELHDNMTSGTPSIVMGDFNSLATMNAVQSWKNRGYADAIESVHEQPMDYPTIKHDWGSGQDVSVRIDYILVPDTLRAIASGAKPGTPSDHNLVWATIEKAF